LATNAEQTLYIHEFGDRSAPGATSAGGHYNPERHEHGLPSRPERHAANLGNLKADVEGTATLNLVVDNITIDGSKNRCRPCSSRRGCSWAAGVSLRDCVS